MRRRLAFSTILFTVLFSGIGLVNPASADALRMGGMGSGMAMLPALFSAFDPQKKATLEVVPSLGSSGGLRALSDGALDIAVVGRELKAEEVAQGLTVAAVARTPFVLVSSKAQPGDFKSSEMANIFGSQKSSWADGTPIKIILRPKSDTDTAALVSNFTGMAQTLEGLRQRKDIPTAATDQDNANLAESIPGSLTASTLTQILMEKRKLHFVSIDGVTPSIETFESGQYRYAKPIYFVLSAKKTDLATRFAAFLRSPQGEAALRMAGNLPGTE
jgi:phosphate transport system substrate-binding protein